MSAAGDVGISADARALPPLDGPIPALFCAAGALLSAVGALAWIAVLAGAHGLAWPIRVLAALALAVGVFTVLVGIGLFRARNAQRAAQAEARLDAQLNAAVDAHRQPQPGHEACDASGVEPAACAGCDATCALNALRS